MQIYLLFALVAVACAGRPPYYYRQFPRMPYPRYPMQYQYNTYGNPYGYMQNGGGVGVGVGVGGGRGNVGVGIGVPGGRGAGVGVGIGTNNGVGVGVGIGGVNNAGYMYPRNYYGGGMIGGGGIIGGGGGMIGGGSMNYPPYINAGSTISIIGYPQSGYGGMGYGGMGYGRQPYYPSPYFQGGRGMRYYDDDMYDRPKPVGAAKTGVVRSRAASFSPVPVAGVASPGMAGSLSSATPNAAGTLSHAPPPTFFRYGIWKSSA